MGREGIEPPQSKTADLQSAELTTCSTYPLDVPGDAAASWCTRHATYSRWSRRRDSNPEPAVYKTAALPIELRRRAQDHTAGDPVAPGNDRARRPRERQPRSGAEPFVFALPLWPLAMDGSDLRSRLAAFAAAFAVVFPVPFPVAFERAVATGDGSPASGPGGTTGSVVLSSEAVDPGPDGSSRWSGSGPRAGARPRARARRTASPATAWSGGPLRADPARAGSAASTTGTGAGMSGADETTCGGPSGAGSIVLGWAGADATPAPARVRGPGPARARARRRRAETGIERVTDRGSAARRHQPPRSPRHAGSPPRTGGSSPRPKR